MIYLYLGCEYLNKTHKCSYHLGIDEQNTPGQVNLTARFIRHMIEWHERFVKKEYLKLHYFYDILL